MRRARTGQEHHRVRHLLRGLHSCVAQQFLPAGFIAKALLSHRFVQGDNTIRHRRARMQAQHTHAVGDRSLTDCLGKSVQGSVASCATDVQVRMGHATHTDHVHYHAMPARPHMREHRACEVDVTEYLQFPRVAPSRLVDTQQPARRNIAGVVHQNVHLRAGC